MLPQARFNIFFLLEPQLKGNVIKLVNSISVTKVTDHKQFQVNHRNLILKNLEAGHIGKIKNQKIITGNIDHGTNTTTNKPNQQH